MRLLLVLGISCTRREPYHAPEDTGADTAASLVTTAPEEPVSDVSWSVHETIGSIIVVEWEQPAEAAVSISFGLPDEEPLRSPTRLREPGPQSELLLGVPYATELSFQINSGDLPGEVFTAQTGPLPDTVPVPVLEAERGDRAAWGATDRWLLLGVSGSGEGWNTDGYWKLIVDREGRVVWAHQTPNGYRSFYVQPSWDGTEILWDENTFWTDFDEGQGSLVHRMTIDGTILETIATPGLHHTFLGLAGGALVWGGVDEEGHEVVRERSADGTVREIWDCTEYWRAQGERQGCDGNALFWNEDDDTLYFSSDNGNTVVEIARGSGELLHVWGQLASAWPFSEGSSVWWKQHSPTRTPDGTLMVSTWATKNNHELRAREYVIDEDSEELREVWSCGEGSGIEAPFAGEARRLSGGNTLLNYGGGGAVREYTTDCAVVWSLRWTDRNTIARASFVEDLYALAR